MLSSPFSRIAGILLLTGAVTLPFFVDAKGEVKKGKLQDAVTIYSKAAPGAVPPGAYRPAPGEMPYFANAQSIPGYAVVKQQRMLSIPEKFSTVTFSDVAAYIDPTTVLFTSLSHPESTHVVEQNYLFDLVSREKLLERYIDRPITVEQTVGNSIERYKGTLVSTQGGVTLSKDDGAVHSLSDFSGIEFPSLPGGLMTKPALSWQVETKQPGEHAVELSYQTEGMTWWADYNVVFTEGKNPNEGKIDLNGWVSILNRSGAGFSDAKLKLVAGEVHRAPQPVMQERMYAMGMATDAAAPRAKGFAEKSFFEYHLYTLQRPATLPDNTTKQLELFAPVRSIPVKKEYRFRGGKVEVGVKFVNAEKEGLGIPLPAGRIRVNKYDDADNSLEFIGEDTIDHTPREEEVKIALGNAFDVVGERKVMNTRQDDGKRIREEDIEVRLRNRKKEDIEVTVEEALGANAKILKPSHEFKKDSAYMVLFPINLPKDKETVLTYTVQYSW
ncbi:MAG: hypothetical protein K0R63_497 [Rickettsiales bacterium]|jgi:hypothetical protein|nr:hypothetical protein [Rickettsiales bacterium]